MSSRPTTYELPHTILNSNSRHSNAREIVAEAARAAHSLALLLLEDAHLRSAGVAVDHAHHPGTRHERRSRENLAAVLLDHQHLVERDLAALLGADPVDENRRAGNHLHLVPAVLHNRVHATLLWWPTK